MAAVSSPVELPTSRNSYHPVESGGDIKDPLWIPLLRNMEARHDPAQEKELSPFAGPSLLPMPVFAHDSFQLAPKTSPLHSFARSSVTPEMAELEAASFPSPPSLPPLPLIPQDALREINFELPATRPTSRYFEKAYISGLPEKTTPASTETGTTEDTTPSESTADTAITTDDATSVQTPTAARNETPVPAPVTKEEVSVPTPPLKEDVSVPAPPTPSVKEKSPVLAPPLPPPPPPPPAKEDSPSLYQQSARSSFSSTRKFSVGPPTSKFNRQPSTSFPIRTSSFQQPEAERPSTAHSYKASSLHSHAQTPNQSPRLTPTQPQLIEIKTSPTRTAKKPSSLRLTPSNASIASHASSDASTPAAVLSPYQDPQHNAASARKSTASLKPQPSKPDVKTLALPRSSLVSTDQKNRKSVVEKKKLPSAMKKPDPARTEKSEAGRIEKPQAAKFAPQPTAGISSFMTANDTVIFRRFDEVHVQLLLCLQDEITQLERELMKLESAILTRSDRDLERGRIIRELRKVVAEYDHLFSSWNQMQANKASKATQQSLRTWLAKPNASAGSAVTAKDELDWLKESKDLSSVSLRQKAGKTSSGGIAGFMGGICGKRK